MQVKYAEKKEVKGFIQHQEMHNYFQMLMIKQRCTNMTLPYSEVG